MTGPRLTHGIANGLLDRMPRLFVYGLKSHAGRIYPTPETNGMPYMPEWWLPSMMTIRLIFLVVTACRILLAITSSPPTTFHFRVSASLCSSKSAGCACRICRLQSGFCTGLLQHRCQFHRLLLMSLARRKKKLRPLKRLWAPHPAFHSPRLLSTYPRHLHHHTAL